MTRSTALLAACALAASLAGGGCVSQDQYRQLNERFAQSEEAQRQLRHEKDALQTQLAEQQKQIETLQALGEKRLAELYQVQRIQLGSHTGGVDLDGKSGDDGIRVYLQPIDQDGGVLKAAGEVKIRLFDLAMDPAANLIGEYTWTVPELSKCWVSGFISYQYSLDCPWRSAPPTHNEITVRVEFTDYLTGKTFTAQTLCKVDLPK